jgi:hypothetical protein
MGRLSQFDADGLARLLGRQSGLISRGQALACAMTQPAIRHRIRPDGPWQMLLPGIYLSNQGVPTTKQKVTAAYLYAEKAIASTPDHSGLGTPACGAGRGGRWRSVECRGGSARADQTRTTAGADV